MHALIASLLLFAGAASPKIAPHPQPPTAPAPAPPDTFGRTLRHTGVVSASAPDLWKTLTTPEGWTSAIGVAKCEIDLRLGGSIRTVYSPAAAIGDDSTITNTILALEPERMLAIRASAPKDAPEHIRAFCETGWTVMRLEPIGASHTQLTVTSMGFLDTDAHQQAYEFFDRGNAWTLQKIQEHFKNAAPPEAGEKAMSVMSRMIGSWSFDMQRPDGTAFAGRNEGVALFDGKLLTINGFLTVGGKTFQHAHFMACVHPRTGMAHAWSVNETGDVTEGEIRAVSDDMLVLDWSTYQRTDGRFVQYRVEYTFRGNDEFRCHVLHEPEADGSRQTLADVTYLRKKGT